MLKIINLMSCNEHAVIKPFIFIFQCLFIISVDVKQNSAVFLIERDAVVFKSKVRFYA